MNPENIITAIEKFFFEIIGQLLPGFLLLLGLYFVLPSGIADDFVPSSSLGYWGVTGLSYAIGGALTALGSYIFIPAYLIIMKSRIISWMLSTRMKEILQSNSEVDSKLIQGSAYKFVESSFPDGASLSTLRNAAMSTIDTSDKETTVRFMFLSLLSQGIATSILIITLVKASILLLNHVDLLESIIHATLIFFLSLGLALPFTLREREFFDRARRLPIDSYFAKLNSKIHIRNTEKATKTVYLSGGHYSGWQDRVISEATRFEYKDPSKNGLTDPRLYTEWDLEAIRRSDIVFAYLEEANPGGYGLSLEVGYAAALGKLIIFIDEKSVKDEEVGRYLKILRETSNVVFDSLSDGISYLNSLS